MCQKQGADEGAARDVPGSYPAILVLDRTQVERIVGHSSVHAGALTMNKSAQVIPFIPTDFAVPETLETEEFRLRMLTVNDVVKDYDAVMSSVDHCKSVWPGGKWPEGLTLEQNLIDLGWHQKEFQTRRSFAYTVVNPSESMVTGCVYIEPTRRQGYDAQIYLWARKSELAGGLEDRLYAAVKDWIAKDWPFKTPGFPGRDIAWETWRAIPNERR
jgi:hypothetical protein